MLLGIIGPKCSGKKSVADALIGKDGFIELYIQPDSPNLDTNRFGSLEDLLAYATINWKKRMLILNIDRYRHYGLLFKRPFFLLLWVDAPFSVRMRRFQPQIQISDDEMVPKLHLLSMQSSTRHSFESFLEADERTLYEPYGRVFNFCENIYNHITTLYSFIDRANIRFVNSTNNQLELLTALSSLNLTGPENLRPPWDTYFMSLCELASKRSNCMKRRVGCIIVSECRVISTGYNGTPKGLTNCNEGGCQRCNDNSPCASSLDQCICLHAEENALLEAGRDRISNRKVSLYCNTCPCLGCTKKIIQVGISEVVYARDYGLDVITSKLFKEANIILRQIKHVDVSLNSYIDISHEL